MDTAGNSAVANGKLPGGVLWLEQRGNRYVKAYGQRALLPEKEPVSEDTIYDAASLTKVLATAPAIMLLAERGKVKLDDPVCAHIPEFSAEGKGAVTLRQLLTHTSGLRPGLSRTPDWSGYEKAIALACAEKLVTAPGAVFRYSDINFIVLGEVVQRASGRKLDEFAAREIFGPLKMSDTGYLPPPEKRARIAPTEPASAGGEMLRGVVHDPTARRMGGVAGHAGVFTTAADLARFCRMMLNAGKLEGVRLLKPETVREMTKIQALGRGLGWDIDTAYSGPRGKHFPIGSYGHTGWTGGSVWIDPASQCFVIFQSNRNHPDGKGNVLPLRHALGTLAAEAIMDVDFNRKQAQPPAPHSSLITQHSSLSTLQGIDVLTRDKFAPLKGLRVGLITNQTGHDRHRNATIDLLKGAPDVSLKALFSPEHGIRGDVDAKVSDSVDEKTGLPVYSLYGESRQPKPEHLKDLDALVFDIQDIGCRYYTYISTLGLCLEAAGQARIKFFVLDCVNPINGVNVDGPVYGGPSSFTAFHPIPVRHGMTVGELALMFNTERGFKADLTVIPLENWSRALWFDQTGLPWTNPSPNMRSATQAALYPAIGLLETTALSVGRGTDTPFEVIGAPYVDDVRLAGALNQAGLSGVRFIPVRFTPNASVFKGQRCAGVNIVLSSRDAFRAVETGVTIAQALHQFYPRDFNIKKFNALLHHPKTIEAIKSGKPPTEFVQGWAIDLEEFKRRREKFLMYKE